MLTQTEPLEAIVRNVYDEVVASLQSAERKERLQRAAGDLLAGQGTTCVAGELPPALIGENLNAAATA
jgi:hypothetical protein